jgi:hypothetical protein
MTRFFLRGMPSGGCWLILALYSCYTGAGLDGVQGEIGVPSFAVSAAPPLRSLWPYQYLHRDNQSKQAPVGTDAAQAKKALGRGQDIDVDNLLLSDTLQMSDDDGEFDIHIPTKSPVLRAEDQGEITQP